MSNRCLWHVVLIGAAFVLTAASANAMDLTGKWVCYGTTHNDRAAYYMRQAKDELWWYGEKDATAPGPGWANVAHGRYDTDSGTFRLRWADVRGSTGNWGMVEVRYSRNDRQLRVVDSSGGFGTKWCEQ